MWQGTEDGTTVDDGTTWLTVPLRARAYSPNLTITQIAVGGADHPHWVIAAAVPNPDRTSTIRLSIALPLNDDGSVPSRDIADVMLQFESIGLEQDRPVWENLAVNAPSRYTEEDATVLAFTLILSLALLQPVKGAVVGLQWALRMHGFDDNPPEGVPPV